MQELLRQLFRHPEVAMLAFAALVAVVGGAIKRAAELAGRGKGAAPPAAPTAGRPPDVGKARRPSPEEVAAEMRQILGMDEKAEPQSAAPPAPKGRKPAAGWKPAPARQPTRSRQPAARKPAATQKPAAARAPTSRSLRDLGQMDVHVDPHVGEQIEQRRAPATGSVGKDALGTLGGKRKPETRLPRRAFSRLVDLQDLPRALVLREILDRPLALREDWPYR